MLVDDDADHRTTMGMLLSGSGFEIDEAGTGEEALERVEQEAYSLILLDFDMPGLDGLETLERLRQKRSEMELPVVMLSNRQDSDIIIRALDHGANDYVTKGTDPDVLLARVRRHLIQKRLPDPVGRPFGGKIGPYTLGDRAKEASLFNLYQAQSEGDERSFALMVMRPGFRVDSELYQSLKGYAHRSIADLVDCGVEPVDYLVYQWVEGSALDEIASERLLPELEVVELAIKIAEAVSEIHETGHYHGQLRPTTVKIREEDQVPQILEFGLSELIVKENSLSRSHDKLGHPAYLAPEQLKTGGKADQRTDLYAIGAIVYTLLTGKHPFEGNIGDILGKVLDEKPPRPSEISKGRGRSFDFLCSKLLSKEPSGRYQSAKELVQKLSEIREELS